MRLKFYLSMPIFLLVLANSKGQNIPIPWFSEVDSSSVKYELTFQSDSVSEILYLLDNNKFISKIEILDCNICSSESRGIFFSKMDTLILVDTAFRSFEETSIIEERKKAYRFELTVDQSEKNLALWIDNKMYKKDSLGIINIPRKGIIFGEDKNCSISIVDLETERVLGFIYLNKKDYGIHLIDVHLNKKPNYYRYVRKGDFFIELDQRQFWQRKLKKPTRKFHIEFEK